MPTTSYPWDFNSAAVAEESTPPDMATTTRVSCGRPSRSRLLSMVPVIDATGQLQALRDQKVIWRLQRGSGLGSGSRFALSETAEEAALSYRPYSREAIQG